MKKLNKSGFALFEAIIIVVIIVAIVAVGYLVIKGHKSSGSNTALNNGSTYQSPTTSTPAAPQINSASDLNSAMSALNQAGISSNTTDSNQLSSQTSTF